MINSRVKIIYPISHAEQLEDTTLMDKVIGPELSAKFQRATKNWFGSLSLSLHLCWAALTVATFFLYEETKIARYFWLISPVVVILLMFELSVKNYEICVKMFSCLETWLICGQLLLFAISIAVLFCSVGIGTFFGLSLLLEGLCLIFGDAYPLRVSSYTRILCLSFGIADIVGLVYISFFGRREAFCHLDLGGYSVMDFAVNRGITFGIFLVRMAIMKQLFSDDCVVLRTRVKVMQLPAYRKKFLSPQPSPTAIIRSVGRRHMLVALHPQEILNVEESNDTLMHKIFGRTITRRYKDFRRKYLKGIGVAMYVVFVCTFCVMFALAQTPYSVDAWAIVNLVAGVLFLLDTTSMMNFWIIKRVVLCFDFWVLLTEVTLCAISLHYVLCQTLYGALISVTTLLSSVVIICCDSLPGTEKKSWRVMIVVFATLFSVAITMMNFPSFTAGWTCDYRVSVTEGRHSFSVLSFLINRGVTFCIVMWRIAYMSFKYPENCAILASRVRIVEAE